MRPRVTLWWRLRALLARQRVLRDIDEELRLHLELQAQELEREGMPPDASRLEASRLFGDVERIRKDCRELSLVGELPRSERRSVPPEPVEGRGRIDMLHQNLRFALRSLTKRRGFAAVAILTLALGIGANTAIFSLAHGVAFRALPVEAPERLVALSCSNPSRGISRNVVTYNDYLQWKEQRDLFDSVAALSRRNFDFTGDGEPRRISGLAVTDEFFSVLRVRTVLGRVFGPEAFRGGTADVVVLGRGFWEREFGGAADIIGKQIELSGERHTVVGVIEEPLPGVSREDVWVPLFFGDPAPAWLQRWDNFFLVGLARLRDGVSLEQAQARLGTLGRGLAEEMPAARAGWEVEVYPLKDSLIDSDVQTAFWVLLGAVSFVLLIACVNVVNLLLVRATERTREIAIRRALGASGSEIFVQLFTESLLLAAAGGLLGLVVARVGLDLFLARAPADIPRLQDVGLHLPVLLFSAAVTLFAAVGFSLVPAMNLSSLDVSGSLKESSRGASQSRSTRRIGDLLVVGEVALSIVLLVGAGLMLRAVVSLYRNDPGVRTENLLTLQIQLPNARYPGKAQELAFFDAALTRMEALPGVVSASACSVLPGGGNGIQLVRAHLKEGDPEPPAGPEQDGMWSAVSPAYFRTLGIPVLKGRDFLESDKEGAPPVIIINRELARRMFPDSEPVGQRIRSWRDENVYREIVGVVGDTRILGLGDEPRSLVYVPRAQVEWPVFMAMMVHTRTDPMALAGPIRETIRELDPALPIQNVATMEQRFHDSIAQRRLLLALLGGFAATALLLAAGGLYGLLSYGVSQRVREFGIRMALGAERGQVRRMVLARGLRLAGLGVILGVPLALGLSQVMVSQLQGVSAADPLTYLGVSGLLLGVAGLATHFPAARATRVDPIQALRYE